MVKPGQETDKGNAAGSAGPSSFALGTGSSNDPFGMAEWLKVQSHPLMQSPAAAFAAATAIGIGMTSHIAGFMLGAMQGMAETAKKAGAADVQTDAPAAKAEADTQAPVKAEKPKRQKMPARVVETAADDLKRISGIGPKLEQVLNGMGIRRYADVALWTDKDVQRFDDQLGFSGRIVRDGWVEQAKALMKG